MSKEFRNEFLKSLNSLAPRIKRVLRFEGTEIASTGETGGTKFLREDGDGTCSWQTVSGGSGAVSAVSNGADNRVATFTGTDALNAEANLTFDGTDLGVSAKIFHVGDTDTYINFTDDDINIQCGGVNFLDFTEDTQNDVTFNEGGVDIDFRIESADETHMLFIEGSSNRMSIGDNTGSPGATLEVKNNASSGATGVPLVQLNSNDTDQQCLDINASNITANVVNVTANAVTTARVLAIGADGLTTGNALYVDDNSADTGTRNTALIIQNNAAAIAATAFTVQSDGGITGVKLDKNYSDTTAATVTGLNIDWDKTGASTSDNTLYGIKIDMDNTTATNGNNTMYGIHCTPTLSHAADAGGAFVYGLLVEATGGSNGSSLAIAGRFAAHSADTNYGIITDVEDGGVDLRLESSADNGDYYQIQVGAAGATTITTSDDAGNKAASVTYNIAGAIKFDGSGVEIENDSTAGAAALLIDNDDTDQIALDIDAANIDADVIDITADAVTTANVMDVTADALTTGGILNLVSDSSSTGTRSLVTIKNDNTAATATTLLHLINDSTSASADMIIESTDADAAAAPKIHFLRNSASPADDDVLGKILFSGKDDADNETLYASIRSEINDQTNSGGQEDGVIVFDIIKNNSQKSALELKNNEAVFNNSGADIDFRIESDDNTHMFFIDGNDNTVAAGGIDATNHKDGFAVFNDFASTAFESTLADGHFGSAEILRYSPGADDSLTAGQLYFLHTDGTWNQTDADAVATGATQLLGIGLGGSARTVGALIKGFIRIPSTEILNLPGSGACDGLPVYVSTTAGHLDFTAPTGTGDFVRVVGYAIDDDSSDVLVYINPSATHVELA